MAVHPRETTRAACQLQDQSIELSGAQPRNDDEGADGDRGARSSGERRDSGKDEKRGKKKSLMDLPTGKQCFAPRYFILQC